jgi:hypothetical protein
MQNHFTKIAVLGSLLFAFSACEKDETQAVFKNTAVPQLTASASTVTITRPTTANPGVTYTWTAADFNFPAAVSYTLQFAKQGTNFATTKDFPLGGALSKSFTVGELNNIYNDLDCNLSATPPVTPLDVRVKASVGDHAPVSMSSVKAVSATPFQAQTPPPHTWGIIGSATPGSWNTDTQMTYDYCSRTWKVTLNLTADEFKFRADNAWTLNYGDDGADKALEPNGANIASPGVGRYEVVLNTDATPKPTYTITPR